MNNIYDIFNERKNGISTICEGYEEVSYPVYESLVDATNALDNIIYENTKEEIEEKRQMYMEDLVFESLMYDKFDAEAMEIALEGKMAEGAKKLKDGVIKVWNRIKAWIESTLETIRNHFLSGKKLIDKYGEKVIKEAINACDVEVKIGWYEGYKAAAGKAEQLMDKLNDNGMIVNGDKQQILNKVGIKDMKDAADKVVKCFMKSENKGSRKIKELNAGEVVEYVANATVALDDLRKNRKDMEKTTKEAISKLDKKDESQAKIAENAKFMLNVRSTMISAEMKCIRKISADYRQIIIKALSKRGHGVEDNDAPKKGTAEPAPKIAGLLPGPVKGGDGVEKGKPVPNPNASKTEKGLVVYGESYEYNEDDMIEENDNLAEIKGMLLLEEIRLNLIRYDLDHVEEAFDFDEEDILQENEITDMFKDGYEKYFAFCYKFALRQYKSKEILELNIKELKAANKEMDNILKNRKDKEKDANIVKRLLSSVSRWVAMYATMGLSVYFKESTAPTTIVRYAKYANELLIKACERRIAEIDERDKK